VGDLASHEGKRVQSAGVLGAFAFALRTRRGLHGADTDRKPVAQMFARLLSGEGMREDSGIGRLRAFLTSDQARLLSRGSDRALAELVLLAIWLEQRGSPWRSSRFRRPARSTSADCSASASR
jgi:hypothetical protein